MAIMVLWIIVFSGVAHLVHAWDARGTGDFLWRLLVGIVYIVVGVFLMLHPRESLASLTLVLAILFLMEAGLMLAAFLWLRRRPGSGWLLLNAVLAGAIGLLIGMNWPIQFRLGNRGAGGCKHSVQWLHPLDDVLECAPCTEIPGLASHGVFDLDQGHLLS